MTGPKESSDKLTWLTAAGAQMGRNDPSHEFLHEVQSNSHFSLAETYWYVVCDPKSGMSANFYTVMRRALGMCAAGVWIYRGFDAHPMLLDHFNWQIALPAPSVVGSRIGMPSIGLEFEIVEPMKAATVRYYPPGGRVDAEIRFKALMPMATSAKETHYDQSLWCEGHVTIDGHRFEIDAPGFRDRTWSEPRPEDPLDYPPMSYSWGVIDSGRAAFVLRGCDDPKGHPWESAYPASEKLFHGGFINYGDRTHAVVRMRKRTRRDDANMGRPLSVNVEFEDETGARHLLTGEPRAAMWFTPWPNGFTWFTFMHWTLDGVSGVGELQEVTWTDFCKRFWKRSVP